MSRTKQTVRKSFGGKSPTKQVAAKAVRRTHGQMVYFRDNYEEKLVPSNVGPHMNDKFLDYHTIPASFRDKIWIWL